MDNTLNKLNEDEFEFLELKVEERKKKEFFHGITINSKGKIYLSKSLAEETLQFNPLSNYNYRLILVKGKKDGSLYLLGKKYSLTEKNTVKEGRELKYSTKCFSTIGRDYIEYIRECNSDIKYSLSLDDISKIKIPISKTPAGVLKDESIFLVLLKSFEAIQKKVPTKK